MKQKKKLALAAVLALVVIVSVMLLLRGRADKPIEGNLLKNADFASQSGGEAQDWETGMWVTGPGVSYVTAVTLEDGTPAALVENVAANDARFEQTVAVRENATYRLTARVRAEGCDEGSVGANLSFIGVYGTSESLFDTKGEWRTLTLYGHTGKGQKSLTVGLRVGGYGSEARGKAWFTDVELVEVEKAPADARVIELSTPTPKKSEVPKDEHGNSIPALLAFACLYAAACAALTLSLLRGKGMKGARGKLIALLLAAFAVRMVLAVTVEGYGVDIGCYSAWAYRMADVGPAGFYGADYFCDYPPAFMLVLGVLGKLAEVFTIALSRLPGQALIKAAPILCDLALSAVLFETVRREADERAALGLAAMVAFNPALIVTGAMWGQIDSVLSVLLVLMLLFARRGKWHIAIPVFALAVLTKPQAGLLAPLGIVALAREFMGRDKQTAKRVGIGILAGLGVTAAVCLPFAAKQESPLWLYDLYVRTLSGYDYATLSTGNLMFLLGGNWVKNTEIVFAGITYGQLGMAFMVLAFASGIAVYWKGQGRSRLLLASAVTLQLVFVLGSKMHERYIVPGLIFLFLAFVETGDILLLASAVLASAATAVNVGVVLEFDYLIAPNLWLGYILSVCQLLAAGMTALSAVRLSLGKAPLRLPAARQENKAETSQRTANYAADARMRRELLAENDYHLHMKLLDWGLMLGLTAVYAVIGFWNLGTDKAPQTGYVSTRAGESVVLDLGEKREDFRIYYYGGISDTQFSFAVSDDGEAFGEENDAFFDRGECFKWQAVRSVSHDESGTVTGASGAMYAFDGRYIRVTFKDAGSALWEVAAVDADGVPYPLTALRQSGAAEGHEADMRTLADEPDAVPDKPGYMNSMYFDEIYHARTGYEHANALHTYETTHPPLGKVFMSLCIRAMGMTPFAWRFAGALCGVVMIPAIYLLARQLLSSTLWAFVSAFLLAFDCMHFTQTRIATIDSFPVLFIMLAFLFMARWMKMSFYHEKLGTTFVPLALSGLFMGLGIASKWIGCYAAVGLAILFFARLYSLWRQSLYAAECREESPAFAYAADSFPALAIKTCLACVVFFVIVPIIVYVLSYIPYLSAYGEVKWNLRTFQRIWDAQVLMYDYHKNLVAEHYFASPWYEWPIIAKPMWYYSADYKAAGMASSILAFGNPAVWWTGLAAIVAALVMSMYRCALPAARLTEGRDDDFDRALPVIAVGFLSAYLPWVLVSRLTFIYHYFASVPFIILATAQMLRYIGRRRKKLSWALAFVLCAAALALFIGFYPLASGMEVPRAWCDAMSWFPRWMWY